MTRHKPFSSIVHNVPRNVFCGVFCLLLTAFCLPPSVFSQSSTATLNGTVEDQKGAVVPGVAVSMVNVATALIRTTTTNEAGYFTIPFLPPGTYTIRAEVQGFAPAETRDVVLNVGDQKALRIELKAGDVNATVQITNEAELIRTDAAVGTVVNRQFVENIPLNGRSFQSLITLTPGVVTVPEATSSTSGQFSVNGQRATANSFSVDGVSANVGSATGTFGTAQSSGNLPGLTTFGTTQSLVSVDALQEFKVQTSGYAAEFGRQPGAQISIVTRSGTNSFHGSLFDYLRNDVFDANDWFANANRQARAPERQNDFGGTFSGPVMLPLFGDGGHQPGYNGRNRTFFFFSYEGLRLRLPQFSLTNVPTLCLRGKGSCLSGQTAGPAGMQPILNAFPLPNGKDLGNGLAEFSAGYSDPSRLDSTGIRLDHTVNRNLAFFVRYNRAPSKTLRRLSGQNLSDIQTSRLGSRTVTLGVLSSFGSRSSNELRINFSNNEAFSSNTLDTFGGAQPLPSSALIPVELDSPTAFATTQLNLPGLTTPAGFVPQTPFVRNRLSRQRQFNVVDNFSYHLGAHQFKFGMDYRRLTPNIDFNSFLLTAFFTSQQQVLSATAGTGTVGANIPQRPVVMNVSAYGQDTWRLSRRLTIDIGVRWDINPAPSEQNGKLPAAVDQIDNLATMQLAPLGTKQWKTTYNNFAPRLGAAYRLSDRAGRETVLRGGFGFFYNTGNDFGVLNFNQRFPYSSSRSLSNISFPLSLVQVTPAPLPINTGLPTPYGTFLAFDPDLRLPYTLQWNFAVEHSLGKAQTVTASYVGSEGRRLLQATQLTLTAINPRFTTIQLTRNSAGSNYNALQIQFQRRLSRGLQALVSYTWSHAFDDDSVGLSQRVAQHGNADFDIRQVFSAAATYNLPAPGKNRVARAVLGRWSIDTTAHAQSAFPVDLVARTQTNPADGSLVNVRPNVITGIPLYLDGSQYPGGRIINNTVPTAAQIAAAGCAPSGAAKGPFCTPATGQSGNFGRNQVRGLPAWQLDAAMRREFKLTEKLNLQFRAEAFNIFNHPNFGTIQTSLGAANFGQATNMLNRQLGGISQLYQIGGPRSFQFALRLSF
jgi:Carboxypeptidase regulatory-like domain/TonB dependent receptor